MTEPNRHILADCLVLLLFLVLVFGGANIALGNRLDDAFITYRYAWNLAHNGELSYNPGNRTLATTSPLSALLYAPVTLFLSRTIFPNAVVVAGLLFAFSSSVLVYIFFRRTRGSINALALALPFVGLTHVYVYAGLETNFYVLCVLVVIMLFALERYLMAGVVVGIGYWVRGDVVLLLGLFVLYSLLLTRRFDVVWKTVLGAGVVLAPTMLFSFYYFGSPVPSTLATKIFQGHEQMFGPMLRELLLYRGPTLITGVPVFNFALVFISLLYLFRLASNPVRRPERVALTLLLSFGFTQILFYVVLGVGSNYAWYQAPLVISAVLGSILGCPDLLHFKKSWFALAISSLILIINWRTTPTTLPWSGSLGDTYIEIANYLNEVSDVDDTIALGEAGMIGYYLERPVFDYFGLIDPFFSLSSDENWFTQIRNEISRVEPDYIVGDYAVISEYVVIKVFDPDYLDWKIPIYERKK